MSPKVSVIIPVYNTGKYIEEAIASITGQIFSDLEVLVVNDGSTDNSLQVIEKVASADERIKVFSQTNKGQATARNVGLGLAKGKYIYLMDSDDILDPEALSSCYQRCEKDGLDFVFFDAEYLNNNNSLSIGIEYDRTQFVDKDVVYNGLDVLSHLLDKGKYRVPPWLNFIRRSYLEQEHLTFLPGLLHEDQIFTSILFCQAQRVGYIPKPFFKRRLRENSIMTNKYSMRNVNTYFTVVDQLLLFAKGKDDKVKQVIDKNVRTVFDPAVYLAKNLTFRERLFVLRKSMSHYRKYVSSKSWIVLVFPWIVNAKALFKKK